MMTEETEMSSDLKERDGEKMQNHMQDLPKRKTDNTAVGPNYDRNVSIWGIFKYADSFDLWLMAFGTVGTIADGITLPMVLLVLSRLIDTIGNFGPGSTGGDHFHHTINMVTIISFTQ